MCSSDEYVEVCSSKLGTKEL